MKCPRCKTENSLDSKFCTLCGTTFIRNRDNNKRNKIVNDITLGAKVCKKCGWVSDSKGIFCEKCGGNLEINHQVAKSKKEVITPFPQVQHDLPKSFGGNVITPLAIILSYIMGIITSKIL